MICALRHFLRHGTARLGAARCGLYVMFAAFRLPTGRGSRLLPEQGDGARRAHEGPLGWHALRYAEGRGECIPLGPRAGCRRRRSPIGSCPWESSLNGPAKARSPSVDDAPTHPATARTDRWVGWNSPRLRSGPVQHALRRYLRACHPPLGTRLFRYPFTLTKRQVFREG
jgi:hypothetical protein